VQGWFAGVWPERSPYRLYALSNFGSLAALLSYPFVFEPALDLPRQSALWSWGFAAYLLLCAAMAACVWRWAGRPAAGLATPTKRPSPLASLPKGEGSSWLDRFRWLALPACASLMLLAATNHVCQDVAVVPFLWVMPLTLYLLSFIIAFDHARWYVRWLWAPLALATLVGAAWNDYAQITTTKIDLIEELALYFSALFCVCMTCHGELARLKPSSNRLTEYYLLVALGGAIGGLLVAVVAPLIFSAYLEWQIGVAASALLALSLLVWETTDRSMKKNWLRRRDANILRLAAMGLALVGGVYYLTIWTLVYALSIDRARNFFGVVAVDQYHVGDPDRHEVLLKNGRITHGRQFADPARRRWPTSYYGETSGVGRAIRWYQRANRPIRIGAIGLGVGTLAAYARPGDFIRFYEINPEVVRMARRHFSYLDDCQGHWEIVLGDARLSLEAELNAPGTGSSSGPLGSENVSAPLASGGFDILVVDAFSGDAIPTHLMTREAMAIYRRHLAPGGTIAFHVSNGYLRLAPVVRRLAEDAGMQSSRINVHADARRLLAGNEWVLVSANKEFLEAVPSDLFDPDGVDRRIPLWTDQYSNLFQILSSR